MKHYAAVLLTAMLGASCVEAAGSAWTNIGIRYRSDCGTDTRSRWSLCGLFHITQTDAIANGGPQALEGYTLVNHESGTVGLALGTIGNIELAGKGDTTEAYALNGGLIVSGPGHVAHASALTLTRPKRKGGYDGPINVDRADYITFDNGWSLRPDGDRLLICDPSSHCRPL